MFPFRLLLVVELLSFFTRTTASTIASRNHTRLATRGPVPSVHAPPTYRTLGDGVQLNPPSNDIGGLAQAAMDFLNKQDGVAPTEYRVDSRTACHAGVSDTVTIIYFNQIFDGNPVVNSVAHVAINRSNKVVAYSFNSRGDPDGILSRNGRISPQAAVEAAEKELGGTRVASFTIPEPQYYITASNMAVLVWVVQIETSIMNYHWYQAYVDAMTGSVVAVNDFVAHAFRYQVVPLTKQSPQDGFQIVTDPQNPNASPTGWHNSKNTAGNNVESFMGIPPHTWSQSESAANEYIFSYNLDLNPSRVPNPSAAMTNVFYVVNMLHDIFYIYGFTERMFNFQDNNLNRGGQVTCNGQDTRTDRDRVSVRLQTTYSANPNEALFATPPDGQPGLMYLPILTATTPNRDSALENDIIIHEMAHGLTNRLTGGGTSLCLQNVDSVVMAEGWSDAIAFWAAQTDASIRDFTMGAWFFTKGIRQHIYTSIKSINPLTYGDFPNMKYDVHNMGEIWATILIEVYWALVEKWGFSTNAHRDASGKEGNVVWLRLLIDALALQPCNPSMSDARDAWIQADMTRYQGIHTCTLWKAFATRGLGEKAAGYNNDGTIPTSCFAQPSTTSLVVPPTGKPPQPTTTNKPPEPITTNKPFEPITTNKPPEPTTQPSPDLLCPYWWPYCEEG